MNINYPNISCVVIGLNCEKTIRRCLDSIGKLRYPKHINIIYVDGGSSDRTIEEARSVAGVNVIELTHDNPAPGQGRNAGWKAADSEWIQFYDGDTIADQEWLEKAAPYTADKSVGAIFGMRKELYPEKNWFHTITDYEWKKPEPDSNFFGGDVLMRRSVLEKTGGYDECLKAGEDPEFSVRVKKTGYKIRGIEALMCYHDINMNNFKQYWSRSVRTGYGYAAGGIKMLKNGDNSFFLKMLKLLIKACLLFCLVSFWIISAKRLWLYLSIALFLFPFITGGNLYMKRCLGLREYFIYNLHYTISLFPQTLGIIKYFIKRPGC